MNEKIMHVVKFCVKANFFISVFSILIVCLMSVGAGNSVFAFNVDLYGPVANNLKMVLVYVAINEIIVFAFIYFSHKYQIATFVGLFLILILGSLKFYGTINHADIDANLFLFFLYAGASHIIFGVLFSPRKDGNDSNLDETGGFMY